MILGIDDPLPFPFCASLGFLRTGWSSRTGNSYSFPRASPPVSVFFRVRPYRLGIFAWGSLLGDLCLGVFGAREGFGHALFKFFGLYEKFCFDLLIM